MAINTTLDEAIERIGHQKAVRNHEVAKALGLEGTKFTRYKADIPNHSIIRIKWENKSHHLVYYGQTVHDPIWSTPSPDFEEWTKWLKQAKGRIVSYLPLDIQQRGPCHD